MGECEGILNYLRQINLFETIAEYRKIPVKAQVIYYKLLAMNNRLDWCEWFSTTNSYLMGKSGFSNEQAFIRSRRILLENGLIKFIAGRRGVPSKYNLVPLTKQSDSNIENLNSSNGDNFLPIEKAISSQIVSSGDSNPLAKQPDIYKQAKQTKQNSSRAVETVDNVDNSDYANGKKLVEQLSLEVFYDYVKQNVCRCPAKKMLLKSEIAGKYLAKSDLKTLCDVLDCFIAQNGRHIKLFDTLLFQATKVKSQWDENLAKNRPK